ncbi:hypothetical protein CVT25_002091 [Psilocybe cyanescens]|uniref:Cytochrome P450 n=1 Tax=Psilocybe cyanescens TaxID=93625 RepID=A0A409X9E3_PSICY|nr:hypothetical protein CVT25_002091 [Psilocybe cyanescens]
MPDSIAMVYALLAILGLKIFIDFLARAKARPPYPPGPKPKPLIGNIFDFPAAKPALCYVDWGKKYNSSILYAEALGNRVLIVNNRDDAIEIFEKRARIYSDRPVIPILKLMGWQYNFAFFQYGEEWRQHRKISQQNFNLKASQKYYPIQVKKVHQLLRALHDTPEDFDTHNKMLSISLAMEMMYGLEVKSIQDPCVAIADEAIKLGTDLLVPGSSLINTFPFLQHVPTWFPGATSRKQADIVRCLTEEMIRIPVDKMKTAFEEGRAVPSFFTDFFEKKQNFGASKEEEQAMQNIAYTFYGVLLPIFCAQCFHQTISATGSFFYFMAVNPDVQKKAQAEIDRVTGSTRLPTFNDRTSMPYVEAIYREVMRLRPPLPIGVPHRLIEDDYFKGYLIPEGTAVFANIWAMTHDEAVYPDAFSFKPERFFDEEGVLNDDDRILAYGFGRRICVGKHIASSTMWLMIASVIACFDITKSKDENGNDIDINDDILDSGLLKWAPYCFSRPNVYSLDFLLPYLSQQAKFMCSFKVRSPAVKKLIVEGN